MLACLCTTPMVLFAVYAMTYAANPRRIYCRATCAALPLPVECLLLSSAFLYSLARFAIVSFVDSSRFFMLTEP
jgi:hypothetical protein